MSSLLSGNRTTLLLALAIAASAAVLAASEFMTTFEFTPPGGEALEVPQEVTEAADRHNYAMLVLSIFALVAMLGAVAYGSQASAYAVAAAGGIALLIFLIGDLPDAGRIGTIDDDRQSFIDAEAQPQPGFWLELIGALLLAICGGALATMPQSELQLGPGTGGDAGGRARAAGGEGEGAEEASESGRGAKGARKPRKGAGAGAKRGKGIRKKGKGAAKSGKGSRKRAKAAGDAEEGDEGWEWPDAEKKSGARKTD